jgi:hypothetical protein
MKGGENILKIKLPLEIYLGVRVVRKYSINFNKYRNWNGFKEGEIKKKFSSSLIIPEFKADKIRIKYDVYFKGKRRRDLFNYISIADKYFCDELVNRGFIEDDDYTRVFYGAPEFAGYADSNYIIASVEVIE